ncbi:hypothetical protein, variant 1 [Phytophthora nicotianae]|uniref:Uncharacterized protein n=1 Tax=Phytophthora nicotianae TaxID=4792 RepID=W2LMB5_PHYNI|nr:hypothetical protein L917_05017 [Phytophthora nicotianae]ETL97766.1 hypothetical protein, variant 1 [Phytophthora nicotianae]
MDLESLYERVLRSVPVNCLQDSYNDVLKEEILLIDRAVSDVSAAFAKLEEIRDAMDKLGNGSTGSRSASLVKIMENTRKMQCELNTKLDKVISGMMATGQKRKRELETESPKGTVKLPPRMIGETGKSQTWSGTLSKDNCLDEMRKLTQMTVLERNEHVPAVLLQLRNIICEMCLGRGIIMMKYMVLWANLSLGTRNLLEGFRSFCEAVSPRIAQIYDEAPRPLGLRRLRDTLLEVVEYQMSLENEELSEEVRLTYDLYVWLLDALEPEERAHHFPLAVSALKDEMSCGSSGNRPIEITKAMKLVGKWAQDASQTPLPSHLCDDLVEEGKVYVNKLSSFLIKADLIGALRKIESSTRDVFQSTVEERAANALSWTRQLKEGASVEDVDKGILLLDEVIRHQEEGWKPRNNEDVRECCDILKFHSLTLDVGPCQGQRLAVISKWRLNRYQTKTDSGSATANNPKKERGQRG